MMDEHLMRVWNDGHAGFSADFTRGLKRLTAPLRRLGEWIAPTSAPGADVFFAGAATGCGVRAKDPAG